MSYESSKKREKYEPFYGNLADMSRHGLLARSVGEDILIDIIWNYLELLDTAAIVYEENGDYGAGILASSWCRFLDQASRRLCNTDDNREAWACEKWHCHESCWGEASKVAIETGRPVDITCRGGIQVYAVPIRTGGEIVGSIHIAYGDPPKDPEKLKEIATRFGVTPEELVKHAEAYHSGPPFLIDIAKSQLETSAKLIGEMVERKRAEDALIVTNTRLKALVQAIPDATYFKDKDGRNLVVNAAYQALLGMDESAIIGRTDDEFLPAEMAELCRKSDLEVLTKSEKLCFEEEIIGKEGTRTVFETIKAPIFDADRKIVGLVGVSRDITQTRMAEEILRESELRYRTLFESSRDAIYVRNQKGELLAVNQAMLELFGYSMHEMTGMNVREFYDDPDGMRKLEKDLEMRGSVQDYEETLRRKDKTEIQCLISASVRKDVEGRILGYQGIIRDVTAQKQAEEALTQSEMKFRALFEKSGDAILLLDDGRLIDCNQAAVDMMGCTKRDELIGLFTGELSPENQPDGSLSFEKATHVRGKALAAGTLRFEWVFRKLNGIEFSAEVLLTAIPLGDRKILHTVIRDITDRKLAEQALRESEERFRKFADEVSFEGLIIHHQGKILDINRQFSAMYGYERKELIGKRVLETIAPEYRKVVEGNVQAGYEKRYEAVALRKDRSTFPVEIHAKNIPFDGKTVRAGAVRDISAQKEAQESLRMEKEKFRVLVEESPLGVTLAGKEGDTKYVNPTFVRMFGYTLEDITSGREWFGLAFPDSDYRKDVISTWVKDVDNANIREVRAKVFTVTCKDGSEKVIRFRSVRLENEDRIVIYEDTTESRRLQDQLQQAQKMEAIGTLAGGIAHDFNNILGAIIGYTELAQDSLPPDSQVLYDLEQVLRAGNRAKELVKQILTFSRQTDSQIRPLRVSLILKEVIKLLRASLPSSIEICPGIEADSCTVMADPTHMHQVLMNLCTNAAYAMRDEGGVLEIAAMEAELDAEAAKAYPDLNPGPYFSLSVRDTGHGMTPDVVERIFDPYFSTKPAGEGTGLGLAVVHGIIKSYGGAITVQSSHDEGTTFHILLPRVKTDYIREPDGLEPLPVGNESILFVDDEKAIVDIAQQQLVSLGYDVVVRASSMEALELFRAQPFRFDLVITDQTMPNMPGSALGQELMGIRPDIPIILCTGFSELITEERAKSIGFKAFVKKPISKKELAYAIRKVLNR